MVPGSEDGCPICDDRLNATLKCSGCRRQVYCSKEHQRQDWPNHRSVCQAWEIHESPELGRHLLASRDLSPGDLILSESPLVWGPALHTDQRVCIGCGEQCKFCTTICKFCLWPACQVDCPGLTDKNRHGLECPLLLNAKIVPRFVQVIRWIVLWNFSFRHAHYLIRVFKILYMVLCPGRQSLVWICWFYYARIVIR